MLSTAVLCVDACFSQEHRYLVLPKIAMVRNIHLRHFRHLGHQMNHLYQPRIQHNHHPLPHLHLLFVHLLLKMNVANGSIESTSLDNAVWICDKLRKQQCIAEPICLDKSHRSDIPCSTLSKSACKNSSGCDWVRITMAYLKFARISAIMLQLDHKAKLLLTL